MAQPDRPLRADAARNRARVLEVAYDTFAAEGLSVPIDEIARRAGVGAGTVYRHFPTKEDLYRAVVEDRIADIVDEGRELAGRRRPRGAVRLPAVGRTAMGCGRPRTGRRAGRHRDRHRDRDARGRGGRSSASWPTCWRPRRRRARRGRDVDVRRRQGDPRRVPGDAGHQAGCGRAADRSRPRRPPRTVNALHSPRPSAKNALGTRDQ